MDAAVCALWALCRHWHDPKAAIIAAVRGKGLARHVFLHYLHVHTHYKDAKDVCISLVHSYTICVHRDMGRFGVVRYKVEMTHAMRQLPDYWHDTWLCYVQVSSQSCKMDTGGGDADTIAAMAGALGGALHGTQWIPEQW